MTKKRQENETSKLIKDMSVNTPPITIEAPFLNDDIPKYLKELYIWQEESRQVNTGPILSTRNYSTTPSLS